MNKHWFITYGKSKVFGMCPSCDKLALDQGANLDLLGTVLCNSFVCLVKAIISHDFRKNFHGIVVESKITKITTGCVVQELVEHLPITIGCGVTHSSASQRAIFKAVKRYC